MKAKFIPAVFILMLSSFQVFCQNEGIYNLHVPELMHIWSRLGDYSPVLRSIEAAPCEYTFISARMDACCCCHLKIPAYCLACIQILLSGKKPVHGIAEKAIK